MKIEPFTPVIDAFEKSMLVLVYKYRVFYRDFVDEATGGGVYEDHHRVWDN